MRIRCAADSEACLDATCESFPTARSDLNGQVIGRTGQSFNSAPTGQDFLSTQYSFPIKVGLAAAPLGLGDGLLRASNGPPGVGTTFSVPRCPAGCSPDYEIISSRLSCDFLDDRAQVALWEKNLLNGAYFDDKFAIGAAFGSAKRWYQAPWTPGGELSDRF